MKQFYKIFIFASILFLSSLQSYSQIGAVYLTRTTGTLSGVPFTLTNATTSSSFQYDLTTTQYSGAPLSNSETVFALTADTNWTVTFDSPIPNLRLYCISWRTSLVEFDQPFTILSGDTFFTNPGGNQLDTCCFAKGILEFTNPVTTLNLNLLSGGSGSLVGITFGLDTTLSIDNDNNDLLDTVIKLFPNPSNDYIELSGVTNIENYKIFNVLGAEVGQGVISDNKKIDIKNLNNGLFFLKIANRNTLKFIKE